MDSKTEREKCRCLRRAGRLKRRMLSQKKAERIAGEMRLLANPTRLQILRILCREDTCVCVLCELTGKSQPNISQHLSILKRAGYLEDYEVGKLSFYRIRRNGIKDILREVCGK